MSIRRIIATTVLAIIVGAFIQPAVAQSPKRIQLSQLEDMFANMRAKTKWNVDGPLLWGYFFFDPSQEKLRLAGAQLERMGYRLVGVEQVRSKQLFRLHIEKIEALTPTSLNQRNVDFYAFAEQRSIASYDGMDVGPIAKEQSPK